MRKSAKQCKARWHEWLDPSIKKTEWSREEEEKLLHLAKLMPTQWRTIAPIVGRTAAQCLEHYERLLDQATRRGDAGDSSAVDDPRRLRPGEIDPNPESKPARPDPVDMDEDEKEMLSEARARLANTRGKKAKRKAREKQLEESRRLAALQKRRELKAAGIELASRTRKVRGVDYNTEIPFQKVAPAGYFDTTGEDVAAEAAAGLEDGAFRSTLKSKLDAPNRDAAEAKARKADAEKLKRRREEALPDVIAQINKKADLEAMRKRGRLMLPPPQVTDRELDAVVKASAAGMVDEGGSEATRTLTASYDQTPFAGAMRTPRTASGSGGADAVLEEAAAQAAMIASDTPLMGGESAPLSSLGDFSGATPRHTMQQTPNPIALSATPCGGGRPSATSTRTLANSSLSAGNSSAAGFTPARSEAGFSATSSEFGRTPSRDAFGINETEPSEYGSIASGLPASAAKRLARQRREALAASLGSLPAPTNEYKIVMPEIEPEPDEADDAAGGQYPEGYVEDALDEQERADAQAAAALAADLAKRSTALQRSLPRPLIVNRDEMLSAPTGADAAALDSAPAIRAADKAIREEMVKMLEAEAFVYPVPGAPEGKTRKRKPLKSLEPEVAAAAAAMVEAEIQSSARKRLEPADLAAACLAAQAELAYVPSLQRYATLGSVKAAEALQAPQQQLQLLKNFMAKDAKKAGKAEKKLDILLGGYKKRASSLIKEMERRHASILDKRIELNCFRSLEEREALAAPQRLNDLTAMVAEQEKKESELQARYAELMRTRQTLLQQTRARTAAAAASAD